LPEGVIDLSPDWGCEIVSPGHEIKDTRHLPLLLKRHRVPWYWLIWPEARTLVAHAQRDGEWQTILTLQATGPVIVGRVRRALRTIVSARSLPRRNPTPTPHVGLRCANPTYQLE
jgi:hypothetical protein